MAQQPLYHIGFGKNDLGTLSPTIALLCGAPDRTERNAKETEGVRR